jgi:hypothetical protein
VGRRAPERRRRTRTPNRGPHRRARRPGRPGRHRDRAGSPRGRPRPLAFAGDSTSGNRVNQARRRRHRYSIPPERPSTSHRSGRSRCPACSSINELSLGLGQPSNIPGSSVGEWSTGKEAWESGAIQRGSAFPPQHIHRCHSLDVVIKFADAGASSGPAEAPLGPS